MRSMVVITKRGEGYISSVAGRFGVEHRGARCGLTPYDAAATAARLMLEYSQSNPEGGDLMAPLEVMELVPEHLRSVIGIFDPSRCQSCSGNGEINGISCPPCHGTGFRGAALAHELRRLRELADTE